MAYEKHIYFDSHETYQDGFNRNHPKYTFNEQIYGCGFYIKRVAFTNYISDIVDPVYLRFKIWPTVGISDNTFSPLNSFEYKFRFTSEMAINSQTISAALTKLSNDQYEDNTNVHAGARFIKIKFVDNFLGDTSRIGMVAVNTGTSAHPPNYMFGVSWVIDDPSHIDSLNQIKNMYGIYSDPDQEIILYSNFSMNPSNHTDTESFMAPLIDIAPGDPVRDQYTSANARVLNDPIFDPILPKYLFLHSNLAQHFITKNQLKIGNRQTHLQNDVIAVIPVTSDTYGERLVWEETSTIDLSKSIQSSNMTDINNIEFWFSVRYSNGKELKVGFSGKTFQILMGYFTNQI